MARVDEPSKFAAVSSSSDFSFPRRIFWVAVNGSSSDKGNPTRHLVIGHLAKRPLNAISAAFVVVTTASFPGSETTATSSPRNIIRVRSSGRDANVRVPVENAFHLDRSDVFARPTNDVLLSDRRNAEDPSSSCQHDIPGVQPTAFPKFLGCFRVLEVSRAKAVARIIPRSPHQQLTGNGPALTSCPASSTTRTANIFAGPAEAGTVPTFRGSLCALITPPLPVSVQAQASIRGNPYRSSNSACSFGIDARAKSEADIVIAIGLQTARLPSALAALRQGNAQSVASDLRTDSHQLRG